MALDERSLLNILECLGMIADAFADPSQDPITRESIAQEIHDRVNLVYDTLGYTVVQDDDVVPLSTWASDGGFVPEEGE